MKIGLQTCSLDRNGYGRWGEDAYKKLKEHGYSCSDFNMADTDSLLYTLPQEAADAILLHEKALACAAGIEIVQAHGPWRYPPRDCCEEDRAERMEKMKASIRAAHLLGCRNWVVHPIMPFGIEDILHGDEEKTWQYNLKFMREILKTAEKYGITICLENMPRALFASLQQGLPATYLNQRDMSAAHIEVHGSVQQYIVSFSLVKPPENYFQENSTKCGSILPRSTLLVVYRYLKRESARLQTLSQILFNMNYRQFI